MPQNSGRLNHRRSRCINQAIEPLEARRMFARLVGIDVSTYQPNVNWTTVATVKDFAIVRATAGLNTVDTQFANNVNASSGAAAKGLYVGFYHYAYYDIDETHTAVAEADHFYDVVRNYLLTDGKHIMPVLDVEQPLRDGWTGTDLSQWVTDWCNRVTSRALSEKGLDINPIIYAGAYNAGGQLNTSIAEYFPDWIPSWPTTLPDPQTAEPSNIGHYQDWSFWQYAGGATGTCPGVGNGTTTPCDLDVFQGDDEGIKDYIIGSAGRWTDGTRVQVNATALKAWSDSTCNTNAPYSDTYISVPNGTLGTILQGPVYGNGYMRWRIQYDNGTTGWSAEAFLNNATPGLASNPNPATGASFMTPPATFTWTAAANATTYDVYLDGVFQANVATNGWTHGAMTTAGHTWRIDPRNGVAVRAGTNWTFTVSPLPGTPSSPNHNADVVTAKPVTLDWADAANATSYDVYLGTNANPTYVDLVVSQVTGLNPSDGTLLWRVVAKNSSGSTTGPQWSYTLDTTAPTAVYGAQVPVAGSAFLDFTVTYSDATATVDVSTLDNNDLTVTGPNGYSANASFISVDVNTNGTPRVATYRIAAPGGTWNLDDAGTYTVTQNATQVKDVPGNYRTSGAVGTFSGTVAFAWMSGSVLNIEFDGSPMPILLNTSAANVTATKNGNTLSFPGVTQILALGTGNGDNLQIHAPLTPPLTFNNGNGNDTVEVTGGIYAFASNLSPALRNVSVTIDIGASGIFNAIQHLNGLTINGSAVANALLVTQSLAISGVLDLKDNDLIIDYTSLSPLGIWSESAYSGVSGRIVSGQNGGAWNGFGLVTSQTDAQTGLTTLGTGEASGILSLSGSDTDLFSGQTVDATSVLIKYTYTGDANLDGFIDATDYFYIDNNISTPGAFAYSNGDFNYDGSIDGTDYFYIDDNIVNQGSPL